MLSAASPSAPAMFARAPLSALATNAAMQPLLVALCGGAAGFDRTHPPTTCLRAPEDIRTRTARLTESRPNSQEVGKICQRNAGHRNSKGRR